MVVVSRKITEVTSCSLGSGQMMVTRVPGRFFFIWIGV